MPAMVTRLAAVAIPCGKRGAVCCTAVAIGPRFAESHVLPLMRRFLVADGDAIARARRAADRKIAHLAVAFAVTRSLCD